METIGLVDIDGKNFPNLPLMKISAYHKAKGDKVEFAVPMFGEYDILYLSKVFSFSEDDKFRYNAKKVVRGGTGYAIHLVNGIEVYDKSIDQSLPKEIEHIFPDYTLYGDMTKDTAYGFLSRGCPRGCKFCHVSSKEGHRSYKVADVSEFWNGQKNIVICDPNILACREWSELLSQLIDTSSYIDFNQGIDARLMTKEKAEILGKIKMKEIHFAWDRYNEGDKVIKGLKIYQEYADKKPNAHNSIVYTIVNFDTTFEQDLERIYTLRELGYWAYVMVYDKQHCERKYLDLQRWCNRRSIFSSCERFEDYR